MIRGNRVSGEIGGNRVARSGEVWLSWGTQRMQLKRKPSGFGRNAGMVSTGFLVGFLLLTSIVSLGDLHLLTHSTDGNDSDSCALCLLARDHFVAGDLPERFQPDVSLLVELAPVQNLPEPRTFEFRLSPSRAPPANA